MWSKAKPDKTQKGNRQDILNNWLRFINVDLAALLH